MRRVKGCTSRKLQQEFPELKIRYWGQKFWARGYFCTTSGMITDQAIMDYIANHVPTESTDISQQIQMKRLLNYNRSTNLLWTLS